MNSTDRFTVSKKFDEEIAASGGGRFSIPGDGSILLTSLLEKLNMSADVPSVAGISNE